MIVKTLLTLAILASFALACNYGLMIEIYGVVSPELCANYDKMTAKVYTPKVIPPPKPNVIQLEKPRGPTKEETEAIVLPPLVVTPPAQTAHIGTESIKQDNNQEPPGPWFGRYFWLIGLG